MKHFILVAVILLALSQSVSAAPLVLNFSNEELASISFDGAGNFSFPSTSTFDFSITSSSGGTGSATGLTGNITGTYAIGTVASPFAMVEIAPVTGSGTLSIFDGANTFSAALAFNNIAMIGAGGTINQNASVNLTGFSYSGTNADLLTLKNDLTAVGVITFQFGVPTNDLIFLKANNTTTSYSGTITANPVPAPEPSALLLLGSSLVGIASVVRFRHRK